MSKRSARQKRSSNDRSSNGRSFARIHLIEAVALCWLAILVGFFGGAYVYSTEAWPFPIIKEFEDFVAGHEEEKTSLKKKVESDLNIKPSRHIVTASGLEDFARKKYGNNLKKLNGLPLKSRREQPLMFLSDNAPRGYRVMYGAFDFLKTLHGVILLDPDGKVVNVWHASQESVPWFHPQDVNIYPHGFAIAPDGSIVTGYDTGTSLIKYDYCGNVLWGSQIGAHHSITFDDDGDIWTWGEPRGYPGGNWLMKVDYETGKVLKKFNLLHVMEANPLIDIFGILQDYEGNWINPEDPGFFWHSNDIEALPRGLERYYPQFRAGDLLVSVRQPDLIFVMDPQNLKVKWWRQGLARRPHDPDWNDDGTITIFNNNSQRVHSNILELDPKTMDYDIAVDGKEYQFYTQIRGKHQRISDGRYLITSSNQGRVFEVGPKGDVTFEFLNLYDDKTQEEGKSELLVVSEAVFLPIDYFKELPKCD
jgi:hypothetical protein